MDGDELQTLVSEQQKQLMAASDLESDLDLAFRLQLQEAMVASLIDQPSSSSSSSTTLPPPLPDSEDHISHIMKIQTLELDKFQQERKDREQSEAEMLRISEDLKRRIHDEKFAREINEMPEEDWEEFGDNFEKPMEAIEEPFRLYFKGLVSQELVNGSVVSLSAIGVTVCDPRDKIVLKIQKPLYGVTSRGVAETKALIEGLSAVISLDIKNIDVVFDYVPLYNHIRGRWAVKQRKIANLVSQVLLLQRKLERCHMSLLARCHVKFVFKMARDEIDTQLTKHVEPTASKNVKEACSICLEDADASQMFSVDGCLHRYCFSCMKQHVEVKLLHGMMPGCPHEGCNMKLDVNSSKKFLTPKLTQIMIERIKEASIPETEKFYCPYPKCSALMSRSDIIRPPQESSSIHQAVIRSVIRKCIKCNGLFCLNCKVPWHVKMTCHEYKLSHPYARAEDAKLQSLAKQKLWRQCVKCNHMIELAEGCFHMTCRCGYEFCYTCGAEWRNKKATCSCPLWDEDYILYDEDDDSDDFYEDDDEYEYEYDSDDDEGMPIY
eukprot:TRINITY_DN5329_c0_g1_i1.p1 TRINITY_DN5329_c0_g1~~TRINITY_DN5329_c0_g1_i1.p1  ORF type:complete len:550 (-),score=87.71 TRINITY_DN5329_c0_g1_i1:261-1910(-)